jgi:hypothetical protein
METVFEILIAILHWRLLLSVGVSVFVALTLSKAFAGFTAGYCISLVLLATGFGIVWQSRAEAGVSLLAPVPSTPISKPLAFLGFLLIGFFWGGLASWLYGSQMAGAIALVCSVGVVSLWHWFVLHRPPSISYLAFTCASLLSGYALLLLLNASNA